MSVGRTAPAGSLCSASSDLESGKLVTGAGKGSGDRKTDSRRIRTAQSGLLTVLAARTDRASTARAAYL